jgi:hypothetical protein
MLKRLLFLIICCTTTGLQGQSIFVFFDDNKDKSSYVYSFETEIITMLDSLHKTNDSSSLIFKKVIDNSTISDSERYLDSLRDIIGRTDTFIHKNEQGEVATKVYNQKILNVNYLLALKVQKIGKYLRYIIKLYETYPSKKDNTFLAFNLNTVKRIQVDVSEDDLKEGKELLLAKIKSLFPKSNQPPIARIMINQKLVSNNEVVEIGLGDTIIIDGGYSNDPNHSPEFFDYDWKQESAKGKNRYQILSLESDSMKQAVIINRAGIHDISLSVSDGVHASSKANIQIKTVKRPVIEMTSNSLIKVRKQGNMLTYGYKLKKKLFFNQQDLTNQDTLAIQLNHSELRKTYEIFIGKDSLQQSYNSTSNQLKLNIKNRLMPGYYQYEIGTKNKLLTSPKQYLVVDYDTDFFGWVNGNYELHRFTFSNGTSSQQIVMSGIQFRMKAFMIYNIGLEVGFGEIFQAKSEETTIDNIEVKQLNHFALIYKIPLAFPKPRINISTFIALSYLHNEYDAVSNSLSYTPRLGLGYELTVQLSTK